MEFENCNFVKASTRRRTPVVINSSTWVKPTTIPCDMDCDVTLRKDGDRPSFMVIDGG